MDNDQQSPVDEFTQLSEEIYSVTVDLGIQEREVRGITVPIPEDPVKFGLNKFLMLLSEVHGKKERVSAIITEVLSIKSTWETYSTKVVRLYTVHRNTILREPKVAQLRNRDLQEAEVETRLPDLVRLRDYCTDVLRYVDTVYKICTQVALMLDDKSSTVSRQISVIHMMFRTGEISTKFS